MKLNMPTSTTGYYYLKFGKRPKNRDFSYTQYVKEKKKTPSNQTLTTILSKAIGWREIIEIMQTSNFRDAYFQLATMKLLIELSKDLQSTPEELKLFNEFFKTPLKTSKQPVHAREKTEKPSPNMEDIFKEEKRRLDAESSERRANLKET